MSRTQKEKLQTRMNIPLQLSELSTKESAVTSANGCNLESSLEKRKKEDDKPIYLRRI
jgi:hypothetical protein